MATTTPPVGLKALLECCRDIEILCSRLYVLFAEAHKADAEAHELWRKTAKEEDNHADQLRLALKLEGALNGAQVSIEEARAVRDEMKHLVADVRKKTPSIPEALRMAIDLEKKLAAFHVSQAAVFGSGAQKALFEAMMRANDGHVTALEVALLAHTPPGKP